MLFQADDALVASQNVDSILRNEIGKYFKLKEESVGPQKKNLGSSARKIELENSVDAWAFSYSQNVKTATKNVEDSPRKLDKKLLSRAKTPLCSEIRPELDKFPELASQ